MKSVRVVFEIAAQVRYDPTETDLEEAVEHLRPKFVSEEDTIRASSAEILGWNAPEKESVGIEEEDEEEAWG